MKKILKQQKRKREYEGKTALGVLYLFTFGLFGAGWIFDLIAILSKKEDTYYT